MPAAGTGAAPVLSVAGLAKTFATAAGPVEAVRRLDLDVQPGAFVAVLGPSGCGKTTILRMIGGLEPPSGGTVAIEGRPLWSSGGRPDGAAVSGLAFAFQEARLFPWFNVEDNIALPLRVRGRAKAERLAFIRHARGLGFELAAVRSLIDLAERPDQDCAAVDRIASLHLADVETKIASLEALRDELRRLVKACAGGRVASCLIIGALGDHRHCGTDHRPG